MRIVSQWPIIGVNFFYYGFIGSFISYLAIVLTDKGFDSVEIGQVFALFTILRVLTGHVWSHFADVKNKTKLFFQLGILFTCFTLLPAMIYGSKEVVFWSVLVSLVCFLSVISQVEVMTLKAANGDPKFYNRIRLFGSVGFIVLTVITGIAIQTFDSFWVMYISYCCLFLILFFTLYYQVEIKRHSVETELEGFWRYCINVGFIAFIVASILLQFSFAPYVSFFTQYLIQSGYQASNVGLIYSLGTFSEVFIFIVAGSILAKFPIKNLLFVCLLLTAARWVLQGYFVTSVWILLATQLIHALSFGLMHSTSIHYIKQHFPDSQQNRAQFMYLGVTFGIGGSLGAWLTGITWQQGEGALFTFQWAALAVFVASLIIAIVPKQKFSTQD